MKTPKYKAKNGKLFFKELRKEVSDVLGKNYKKRANKILAVKAVLMFSFFITTLLVLLFVPVPPRIYLIVVTILGLSCLPLILNIGHEAVHGNLSTNTGINRLAKGIFFFLGTSGYFWELRHNSSHHAFANIKGLDLDIEQSNIIRISDQQEHSKRHRYQHFYMPFAFCSYTLMWFLFRDFKDIGRKHFGAKSVRRHPRIEIFKLVVAKIWHLAFLVVIPFMNTQNIGLVVCGFFVFHVAASIATTFALISTHVGELQEIVHPESSAILPYSWAQHQLVTTADFSTGSTFALHFFGGFNHHVAHHLFPNIPHIYYPKITPLIKKYASDFDLPYHQYPNLISCIKSHFTRLKKLSEEI